MLLLHQGAGSTIDHFLRGPLECMGRDLLELDSARVPAANSLKTLLTASLIVVVRYLPRDWLRPLGRAKRKGSTLIYLMDDDLLDPKILAELPPVYRRRVRKRITAQRGRVPGLFDRVWVTSGFLKQKYAHLGPELLPLHPHPSLLEERPRFQLAYFGTSVHRREFTWLLELLTLLQERHAHTHVDLFGDLSINRQFRDLPRIRILHPMGWPSYLAETGWGRVDVLLTPLMEGPVNAARAPVKFIDAARCGAAGLYSDRSPYRGFIRQDVDGLLLGDRQWDWLETIEQLMDDGDRRRRLAEAGRERAWRICRGG
ncbi:MAG: glycosyltransferase [Cyanobacteriota bacterium]|nr:glycosyltransferase [Cyanobacteriota bacterium]